MMSITPAQLMAWIAAAAQFCLAAVGYMWWTMHSQRNERLHTEDDDDLDNDIVEIEEESALADDSSMIDAASINRRSQLGLAITTVHVVTALMILAGASSAQLHYFGYLSVVIGCITSTYLCICWNFDIPTFTCHGIIAARARIPSPNRMVSACIRGATVSAPLAFLCAVMSMHTVLGSVLFFLAVTYGALLQVRLWWAPYFFGWTPPREVIRYLHAATPYVHRLPQIKDHIVRPDYEAAGLGILSLLLLYCAWGQFVVSLVARDAGDHPPSTSVVGSIRPNIFPTTARAIGGSGSGGNFISAGGWVTR